MLEGVSFTAAVSQLMGLGLPQVLHAALEPQTQDITWCLCILDVVVLSCCLDKSAQPIQQQYKQHYISCIATHADADLQLGSLITPFARRTSNGYAGS